MVYVPFKIHESRKASVVIRALLSCAAKPGHDALTYVSQSGSPSQAYECDLRIRKRIGGPRNECLRYGEKSSKVLPICKEPSFNFSDRDAEDEIWIDWNLQPIQYESLRARIAVEVG